MGSRGWACRMGERTWGRGKNGGREKMLLARGCGRGGQERGVRDKAVRCLEKSDRLKLAGCTDTHVPYSTRAAGTQALAPVGYVHVLLGSCSGGRSFELYTLLGLCGVKTGHTAHQVGKACSLQPPATSNLYHLPAHARPRSPTSRHTCYTPTLALVWPHQTGMHSLYR